MSNTVTDPPEIDVKRAISIAKSYVREVFVDELTSAPTLEEVWYDEDERTWLVTIGIRHRMEMRLTPSGREMTPQADYKTVSISAGDGRPLAIRLYDHAA